MQDRIEYTLKLFRWIDQYPGYWSVVCRTYQDEPVSLTAMLNTIKSLQKHGFYDLIIVFLTTHQDVESIKGIKNNLLLQYFKELLKSGREMELVEMLVEQLK